jgi:hypothetical protein
MKLTYISCNVKESSGYLTNILVLSFQSLHARIMNQHLADIYTLVYYMPVKH